MGTVFERAVLVVEFGALVGGHLADGRWFIAALVGFGLRCEQQPEGGWAHVGSSGVFFFRLFFLGLR